MNGTDIHGVPVHTLDLQWLRGPARHDGGWIVLDKDQATEYTPNVGPQLGLDLAYVRTPEDAVAFAEHYGMLWHGPGSVSLREPFTEWDREASTLREIVNLWLLILSVLRGEHEALTVYRQARERAARKSPDIDTMSERELLGRLTRSIAADVTQRLGEAQEGLVPLWEDDEVVPGEFAFVMTPKDLLSAVYHELGRAIVHRVPLKGCLECGRVFQVRDPRQKYCTPRCSNRSRYRRWSEKRRLEGEGTE